MSTSSSSASGTGATNDYPGTSPMLSGCENAIPSLSGQQDATACEQGTGQAPGSSDMEVDETFSSTGSIFDDSHHQLLELKKNLNQLLINATIASAKVASLKGEARHAASQELDDISKSIKTIIALRDCVMSATNLPVEPRLPSKLNSHAEKVVCPNNLPHFQWEGSVFDHKNTVFVDVDACLLKFEDVMFAYNLDFDSEFRRLVPPMLSPTQRTWYQSFTESTKSHITWANFKEAFKARYGLSVLDDRRRCATDLMSISLHLHESIDSFIDRFNDLRRRSYDQVPQSFLLVTQFMKALPIALRDKVNIIRQSKGINDDAVNVDIIIRVTRDLVSSMSPNEIDTAMNVTKTFTETKLSKWADKHGDKGIPKQGVNASRINKSNISKPGNAKYCQFHKGKHHNHDTSECKVVQELVASGKWNADSGRSSSKLDTRSMESNGPKYIMSLKEARATNSCAICGAANYSKGHECTSAVRTGPPPSSTLRRFQMMHIAEARDSKSSSSTTDTGDTATVPKYCKFHKVKTHSTDDCLVLSKMIAERTPSFSNKKSAVPVACTKPSSSVAITDNAVGLDDPITNNDSAIEDYAATKRISSSAAKATSTAISAPNKTVVSPINDRSTVGIDDAMDVDEIVAIEAQKCKINEYSNLPVNKSNSLLIPLIVESYKVYGVLDTGCTFSICSPQFAKSLGVPINFAVNGHVQLGHSSTIQPRVGTCSLNVFYNKRNFTHQFEIFDFYSESNDCPMLLGLDIMSNLNIGITGLTSSWFEYTGPELPSPIDPDVEPNNDPYGTPSERAQAYKPIEALLKENAAIDLATTYCNLPGAIVNLETIPGKVAYRAPYPVPMVYKDAVLAQLDQWEKDGVIEPSPSHNGWNHPLLVVAKKNAEGAYSFDKPRIVADVRLLNQILVSTDKYQMPRIDEIHHKFSAATITSSVDIKSFFTSFLVAPEHRFKLSITCPFTNKQWSFRKICFGIFFMSNLATRLLSNLFSDMRDNVCLYVDDIGCLSFDGSLENHARLVAEVIRRLTQANLQVNPEKVVFAQRSIHVLGWSIIHNRLVPDARKLTNFHLWPIPKTGKQVMKYLGFCNYFRNAVPGYSELAAPLDELRNYKSLEGVWTENHTKSFKSLQTALASSAALSPIDFRYKIHVATDASATAIGGIIYYIKDNTVHYVTMASRKLSKSEMAYSTTKRELLAIVYMFTKYHKWLFGIPFVLHTDHRSLIWLQTQSSPNSMLLTWYEVIFFHYQYEIVHIPGSRNVLPDALSRLFSSDEVDDHNVSRGNRYNNQSIMVKEKRQQKIAHKIAGLNTAKRGKQKRTELSPHQGLKSSFKQKFKKNNFKYSSFPTKHDPHYFSSLQNDVDIFDAKTYADIEPSCSSSINDQTMLESNNNNAVSVDNVHISRAMKYADYMTPPKAERLEIILRVHLLGHVGINAIEKVLHHDYKVHWTHMRDDITKVLKDCHACQSHGIFRVGYHPPRSALPDNVFDHIAMDLGDFATTSTSGNNYLLVIVDYFSRFLILRAIPDKSPITVAKALLSVCCLFGFPQRITTDNSQEFVGTFIREFVELSGMDRLTSLPYTPNGNGLCESHVGKAKRAIIKSLTHEAAYPEAWDEYLDVVQYAMNIQYARIHKSQPFSVMFNRAPNMFKDYSNEAAVSSVDSGKPDVEVIDKRLQYIKKVVIPAIHKRMKETQLLDHERFEKKHKIVHSKYPINSKVMILNVTRGSKLEPRWLGPYFIKNYTKHGSYVLADITGELLSRDVATQHIRVIDYSDNHITKNLKEQHYEVQAIVNHRRNKTTGKTQFLVNWVGYPDKSDNTWQDESDFDSLRPIKDYWHRISTNNSQHPLPNTVNKRKLNRRRLHAGPTTRPRYPSKSNSRIHNQEQ
ncbi:hypothetical protein INT45_003662 [Circinella minor]|uniref:Reverse transcriptase n=2 Tax=Circinella minor TaxID=1195481 RepID=A0A8H7V9E9_9FUNG|nr:hypothetical protein INT45_003662 [Circinella minor]